MIEQQVVEFLRDGGEVDSIARGVSAHTDAGSPRPPSLFEGPSAPRTPVADVISSLEARRRSGRNGPAKNRKRPQRVPVYDDFGEVIRWVWQEPD